MGFRKAGPSLKAAATLGSIHTTELRAGDRQLRGSRAPPSVPLPCPASLRARLRRTPCAKSLPQALPETDVSAVWLLTGCAGHGAGRALARTPPHRGQGDPGGRPWEETPAWRAHPGAGQPWGQARSRQVTARSCAPSHWAGEGAVPRPQSPAGDSEVERLKHEPGLLVPQRPPGGAHAHVQVQGGPQPT